MLLRSLAIALQWRSQDFAKVTVERWTKLIEGVFYFQYIVADQGFPLKRRPVPPCPLDPPLLCQPSENQLCLSSCCPKFKSVSQHLAFSLWSYFCCSRSRCTLQTKRWRTYRVRPSEEYTMSFCILKNGHRGIGRIDTP